MLLMVFSVAIMATESENLGTRVLPVPGKVVVDGKINDWDLSAGTFACGDVENQRDAYAVWFHAMYDDKNLYVLSRWIDATPMNNPGQTIADYAFQGDCLQMRIITNAGTPDQRASHWSCWQGVDKIDLMDVYFGLFGGKQPPYSRKVRDAKTEGAQQAFLKNADCKGYTQELAIPWAMIMADGKPLTAGQSFSLTIEPNFTLGQKGRLSVKDLFKPGVVPDRVFTFQGYTCWGPATLENKGKVTPAKMRLSDGREFDTKLVNGMPVIDWTGLIKVEVMKGFKDVTFDMPEDGYISLHLKNQEGLVLRQLLNCVFYTKGKHTVKWDGLTTMNWRNPGTPVPEGKYTWEAIWHKGISLQLRGWAANGGIAPWGSGPQTNWGGDQGDPTATAVDETQLYLGWGQAEAGRSLLICDLNGNVKWGNNRAGISGVKSLAANNGVLYVLGGSAGLASSGGMIYKLDAKKGGYLPWGDMAEADLPVKGLWDTAPEKADKIAAIGDKLYVTFTTAGKIAVLDGKTGKLEKTIDFNAPDVIVAFSDTKLYVLSNKYSVMLINPVTNGITTVIDKLNNATAMTVAKDGTIYVGTGEPDNIVNVYTDGKLVKSIGRLGGRPLIGKWSADGMRFINSVVIAGDGKLWVAEKDDNPKRIVAWDTKTNTVWKEFFGPSDYGATGGAINPLNPKIMVGQNAEWQIDAVTGKAICLGVITTKKMGEARFGIGNNGRQYLAVSAWRSGDVSIFERIGDGNYKLRTVIYEPQKKDNVITVWSDRNDDEIEQPEEIAKYDIDLSNGKAGSWYLSSKWITSWYMYMNDDMSFYGTSYRVAPTGFTACGAPEYDLTKIAKLPTNGAGSADNRFILREDTYAKENNTWNSCYDSTTGKLLWSYPDNFVGVHGSHKACPPRQGMIRGSFGPCGSATLPAPIGNIWVIPTNVGEWHILTEKGYYLTRLFEPDPMKFKWPVMAVPDASMDNVPCGMGGEDFGGSIAYTKDGKLFIQAGKTGYWNVEVVGLNNVKEMNGETITITAEDVNTARAYRESYLQEVIGNKKVSIIDSTPLFTGKIDADFKGADIISFSKQDDASVRVAATYDDKMLYLCWEVKDNTPWVNGATDPAQMYIGGDTVDFQIGTDSKAKANRADGVLGDLRVSIGNLQGVAKAMLYRKVATVKKPKIFSSGVVHEYKMEYVDAIPEAAIKVTTRARYGYTVEVAIPLATLGVTPVADMTLHGDFGVTHGDTDGSRTRLRTYWSNQHTGIVDDAVFELQMEPQYWGELLFK